MGKCHEFSHIFRGKIRAEITPAGGVYLIIGSGSFRYFLLYILFKRLQILLPVQGPYSKVKCRLIHPAIHAPVKKQPQAHCQKYQDKQNADTGKGQTEIPNLA